VIVANVSKLLDPNLWSPESFSREFGHIRHDIVNTKSNKIIPKVHF
jgi:lysine-specific demethylase 3